jgi:hypothetical protein
VTNPTTTPAIAVTTALSGVLKGTGTGIAAATAGTDYLTPTGSGAGLTALNAANLGSGTVPTARLGSGTASSTTYLRGDQTWATPAGGGSMAIGGAVTSGTTGSVLYVSGGNLAQDNSNLFYDSTNKRLGVGTASPQAAIDAGAGRFTGGTNASTNRNYLDLSSNALGTTFSTIDCVHSTGAVFRQTNIGILGSNDLFFQLIPSSTSGYGYIESSNAAGMVIGTGSATPIVFRVNRQTKGQVSGTGSWVLGVGALATTATDGYTYLPTCPGAPTGVPTTQTGMAPMLVDTTNSKLWVNVNGTWKSTTLT